MKRWESYHQQRMFNEITEHYDFSDKRIFVGGCGDGIFEEWLLKSGIKPERLIGMDYSLPTLKLAQDRMNRNGFDVKYERGDIRDTRLAGGYFDVAVLIDVLHHVPNPVKALKEMDRIAETIILYEANALNIVRRWNDWRSNGAEPTSFYKWELRRWLKDLGFDKIKVKNTHCIPRFTPDTVFGFMEKLEKILEKIPLLKEMTGALFVLAEGKE